MLSDYEYESEPIRASARRDLRPGGECDTGKNEDFYLSGNFDALISLANHCFDLADPGTPVGTEIAYMPGVQLSSDSIPMTLQKIAGTAPR